MAVRKGGLDNVIAASQGKGKTRVGAKDFLPLSDILDRPHGDAREVDQVHAEELTQSIAERGIIEPIVVDRDGYLLAGAHRREAIRILSQLSNGERDYLNEDLPKTDYKAAWKKWFGRGVPIYRLEGSATEDPAWALEIEVSENEHRKDFKKAEVLAIAEKLKEAGYRHTRGKPKKGQKALAPALMAITGKSRRTVQVYLSGADENAQNCTLTKWERLARQLDKAANDPEAQQIARKLKNMAKVLRELEGGE